MASFKSLLVLAPVLLLSPLYAQTTPPVPTPSPAPTPTGTPVPTPTPVQDPRDTDTPAQPEVSGTPTPVPTATPAPTPTPKPKTIEELTKDHEKIDGLFTLYRRVQKNKQEFLAEIKESQIGPLFLLQSTFSSGGGGRVTAGRPARDIVWRFKKTPDDRLVVSVPNFWYRSNDPALQQAIERDFPDAFVGVLPIQARSEERKTVLVDFAPFFDGSIPNLNDLLQPQGQLATLLDSYALDSNLSFVERVRNFPTNLVVESLYNYRRTRQGTLDDDSLADPRSLPIRVVFNLYELPQDNGYQTRVADPRIGYFINGQLSSGRTGFESFDDPTRTDARVLYINRWNLRKANPTAVVSEPVKPIVFLIDSSVPARYRQVMREGILVWNQAFEPLGFRNAIQVRDAPKPNTPEADDYDHADMRYNTLRWVASPSGGGAYAVALLRENPLTGEILNASITVDANFARSAYREKLDVVNPLAAHTHADGTACAIDAQMVDPRFTDEKYVDDLLRALVAHEFGHILGLRHNFLASTFHSPQALADAAKVRRDGVSASVMDYVGFNVFGLKTGADLFARGPGKYDLWAIQYGYAPLSETMLKRVAARSGEAGLNYYGDELADGYDPTIVRYDLSSDPLTYASTSLAVTRDLLQKLNTLEPKQGESYARFTQRLRNLIRAQTRDAAIAARFVGGFRVRRVVEGDQSKTEPFSPVPLSQQRRALELLAREILAPNAVRVPPQYLTKTAPDPFSLSGGTARDAFPIRDDIASMRATILRGLFAPTRLNRIANGVWKFPNQVLPLTELFPSVRRAVWGDIGAKTAYPALQRDLAAEHLSVLIGLATDKTENAPRDARLLARGELNELKNRLSGPRRTSPDALTRLFFDDALRRIDIALKRRAD